MNVIRKGDNQELRIEAAALVEGLRVAEGRMVRNAQVENMIKP